MPKKSVQSFLPLDTLDWIELLVQNQSIFSLIGTVLEDEQVLESLLGFAPLIGLQKQIRFQSKYFRLRFRGFLLVVVVLFVVALVRDPLVQAMRNSDPRVGNTIVHRFNSNFHYIFAL